MEHQFCERFGHYLGIEMHPDKETSPYGPDLIDRDGDADLKTQNEPFYRAGTYGLNPLQCVTLNKKDVVRYHEKYPSIRIYFWVNFAGGKRFNVAVPKIEAVYALRLVEIIHLMQRNMFPLHYYNNRIEDPVNAQCSYLIDTTIMQQVWPK